MAIIDNDGQSISYESSDLIEELERDIKEFGNFETLAFVKFHNGAKIYYDYQFNEEVSKKLGGKFDTIDAANLLGYLNMQNDIL